MKKRILAIDQGEHLGGAERFFSELLTNSTDEIHLITSGNTEHEKLYAGSSVILHRLELPKLKPIGWKSFLQFRRTQKELGKIIQRIKPDVIISNTVRTHLLISSLAKKFKIPLTWMAHDLTFPPVLLRWFLRYPQKIISCSKYVEEFYRKYTKRSDLKFEVQYPFIITPQKLEELKKIKKEKIIGMVGKFIPWKNQKTFIELAAEVYKKFPEYKFVLIGSPYEGNEESEQYFEECIALIRQLKLDSVLMLKGHVPDVLREMARWEILIHCSTEPEPLGRVILEGLAAGCFVIASPFGGTKEIIQDGERGQLVQPSLKELREAVSKHLIYLLQSL